MRTEIELTKKIVSDALAAGIIPAHMQRQAATYAATGHPWRDVALSNKTDWAEDAIRLAVYAAMWRRTGDEVDQDGCYNTGFICRYGDLCRRYGVQPNGRKLDLCLVV